MKYLLDIKSCLSKSKALYDNSDNEIFTLSSIQSYIGMPKGRSFPSLLDGANEFLNSNVKIISDTIPSFNEIDSFYNFIKSEKGKEFIIVTNDRKILTICQEYNLKKISLSELEKRTVFDEEKYNQGVDKVKEWDSKIFKASILNRFVMLLINVCFFITLIFWNEIIEFFTITLIIPISLIISGILFKIKKQYLFLYTIFQFLFAFATAFIVYNYDKNSIGEISKLMSLISAVFICTKAFQNLDEFLNTKDNKMGKFWRKLY